MNKAAVFKDKGFKPGDLFISSWCHTTSNIGMVLCLYNEHNAANPVLFPENRNKGGYLVWAILLNGVVDYYCEEFMHSL